MASRFYGLKNDRGGREPFTVLDEMGAKNLMNRSFNISPRKHPRENLKLRIVVSAKLLIRCPRLRVVPIFTGPSPARAK